MSFDIGDRLGFLMKGGGWTQTALADKAGVQQSMISQAINGRKSFSFQSLERVTEVLGISLYDFFSDENNRRAPGRDIDDNQGATHKKHRGSNGAVDMDAFNRLLERVEQLTAENALLKSEVERLKGLDPEATHSKKFGEQK